MQLNDLPSDGPIVYNEPEPIRRGDCEELFQWQMPDGQWCVALKGTSRYNKISSPTPSLPILTTAQARDHVYVIKRFNPEDYKSAD